MQEQGAVRTYIGREDIRRRGDRPQYSGSVSVVAAVEGNRVKETSGNVHSMTLTKPVPADSQSTTSNVRLQGSSQTEDRNREEFKKYARALATLLTEHGAMYTSTAVAELLKLQPQFKKDLGKMRSGALLKIFPDLFKLQTSSAGGAPKVLLKR